MPRPLDIGTLSPRAFAVLLLSSVATFMVAIAAFNAAADPTAQLGTGLVEPIAAGPRDRTAKVDLLSQGPMPDRVVLGSSRTKKLDPERVAPTSGRAINAAVVGGDLFEARVLAAYLRTRARQTNAPFPQLVVGVDVEQLRDSSLHGSGFLDVPQVADIARREAGGGQSSSLLDETRRVGGLLLTWETTKASIAAMRAQLHGADTATEAPTQQPEREAATFTSTGLPTGDDAWFGPAARALSARTPERVAASIDATRATYQSIGSTLDAAAVEDLHALVDIAHDAGGPRPLLYLTPAHPRLVSALDDSARVARQRAVVAQLRGTEHARRSWFLDCTSCIPGAPENWIDATHPSPIGAAHLARRLAGALDAQAPSATPVERSGESR